MKHLIKKILKEHSDKKLSDPIFFRVVKQLLRDNADMFGGEYYFESAYDRAQDMHNVTKLFGIDTGGELTDIESKLYWAAYDNKDAINMGTAKSYDDLKLRPLKQYKVTCEESRVEHIWYTWEPVVEAYDSDDAEREVQYDEDGYYGYWEWEDEPGFDKEYGDSEGDGKEITDVVEVEPERVVAPPFAPQPPNLTEAEGPDENELVDGLRHILAKQREAHSEDVWYSDITKLLKRLNIPLHETLRKFK